MAVNTKNRRSRLFSTRTMPSLDEFRKLCSQEVDKARLPLCSEVSCNVPIYDTTKLDIRDTSVAEQLADEFHAILLSGSGVFVLKGMFQNARLLERVNVAFCSIIASEKSAVKGDHFGTGGANDRIWNSFEKQ